MHERAARAVPLVVRPDGQRAERENGIGADVPTRAQDVPDDLACGRGCHQGQRGEPRGAGPELADQRGLGRVLAGRRPGRANAAAVMARMALMSAVSSRRISTGAGGRPALAAALRDDKAETDTEAALRAFERARSRKASVVSRQAGTEDCNRYGAILCSLIPWPAGHPLLHPLARPDQHLPRPSFAASQQIMLRARFPA